MTKGKPYRVTVLHVDGYTVDSDYHTYRKAEAVAWTSSYDHSIDRTYVTDLRTNDVRRAFSRFGKPLPQSGA